VGSHDDQASLNVLSNLQDAFAGVSFLEPVLDAHIVIGCLHGVQGLPDPPIDLVRIASGLELVMTQRRRHDMEHDQARPTITGQGTGQREGLLRVLGQIGGKENGVDR
jgi:hypothetical protein